jgi:hypothetical protein
LKLPLADEDKRKILWDNCARLYGLEAAASASGRPDGEATTTPVPVR